MNFTKFLCSSSIILGIGGCSFIKNNSSSNSSSIKVSESTSSSQYQSSSDVSSNQTQSTSSAVSSSIQNSSSSITKPVGDIEYETFFDLNTRIEITIKMSKDELIKLDNDYHHYDYNGGKSPLSRACDVEIKFGTSTYNFTQVGIKMKGNTSRTSFLNDKNEINNLIHYKLDFSDTFGDTYYDGSEYSLTQDKSERKDRRFLGMEKLDLKWNRNYDGTHIRQVYAYQVFEDFGVMALKMNIGKVNLQIGNDKPKSLGIFEVAEVVDKIFIERRLAVEEVGGDLYKCCYTNMGPANLNANKLDSIIGVEDEETGYFPIYDLKTNKKTSTHQELKNLINYLNSNSVTKDGLAQYVNMDNFLMEEAVAYVLGNPDDLRNNYNNYYIYFGNTSKKAYFIPYDWDRCLGITNGWNPTGNGLIETKHNSNYAQGAKSDQANPLVKYTLGRENNMVIADYHNQFVANIKNIYKSKWANLDYFDYLFKIAKNNYENECYPEFEHIQNSGINFYNGSSKDSNMSFNDYMNQKRAFFYKTIGESIPTPAIW